MCLLNFILISIVTLTHSLPTPVTLSSAIAKYPKYKDTLLSVAVVPFVSECTADKLKGKPKYSCGSYFEMVEKLDQSNPNALITVEQFNKAMEEYSQISIDDFCSKFPSYLPTDAKEYPSSQKLHDSLLKRCLSFCGIIDDIDTVVAPKCKVFAIGFRLSSVTVAVQPTNPVANVTISQPSAEGAPNLGNVQLDTLPKFEPTTGGVKIGKPSVSVPISSNVANVAAIKQVVDETVAKGKVDEVDQKTDEAEKIDANVEKENFIPNAEAAVEDSLKKDTEESEAKPPGAATADIKLNDGPTAKQESKLTDNDLNPSKNPAPSTNTAEKTLIGDGDGDDEGNMNVDGEPKGEADNSVVTDDGLGGDKMVDDSTENRDIDDDNYPVFMPKSHEQAPAKQQLQTEEEDPFTDDTDSNFFAYFMFLLFVCVIAYVVYHNKSKMLALMLEGRRSSSSGRGGLSRRKHTAAYRKLDSNLEEAITSSGNGRSTQVIY